MSAAPHRPIEFNTPEEIMAEIIRVRSEETVAAFNGDRARSQERRNLRITLYGMLTMAIRDEMEAIT